MAEKTPFEKLCYLSRKLSDRLAAVEGNEKDLLSYFMDPEGYVPVSALLLDKSAMDLEGNRRGIVGEKADPSTESRPYVTSRL